MKNKVIALVFLVFLIVGGLFLIFYQSNTSIISPIGKYIEKPLERYSFESLKKKNFSGSDIRFGKVIKEAENFDSYIFYFDSSGPSANSLRKISGQAGQGKVSGLVNVPKNTGTYPVIVMFRGYVDQEIYETGIGTRHAGEVFASNGFITLAPDFLGYGESASPSADSIEERFQTYTTALTILASVKNLNKALEEKGINIKADEEKIGIWGHSNGGHIALSVLEITGKKYPAVLWAPVSKPFPYSILYYTDEFDDHGKALRRVVANFEKDYDIEKYSPTNYLDWISGPIQLHQGGGDDAVPQKWSDQLVQLLKKLNKDIDYYIYPGDDHDFAKGNWLTAVERSMSFYREKFGK